MVTSPLTSPNGTIGADILRGADCIAAFLYGDARLRRKVYNLVATKRLPHFRLGAAICARKSILLAWIKEQEDDAQKAQQAPRR